MARVIFSVSEIMGKVDTAQFLPSDYGCLLINPSSNYVPLRSELKYNQFYINKKYIL